MDMPFTSDEVKGLENEERFFKIVEEALANKQMPSWLVQIEPATIQQDLKGVDAIATVRRRADRKEVSVPVQIKSSVAYLGQYYVKYPEYWKLRVPGIVVNEWQKDKDVLRELLDGLGHVHGHQYDFEELLSSIDATPVDSRHLVEMQRRRDEQSRWQKT